NGAEESSRSRPRSWHGLSRPRAVAVDDRARQHRFWSALRAPRLEQIRAGRNYRTHLEQVGLTDAADRRPARLSGGMQQRVGLARAFAIDPPIMLLHEPFGALDALTRRELQLQLLGIWEASQRTVVMVTHDVDEAILLSDRVLVMSKSPESTIIADINVDLPRPRHDASEDPAVETKTAELRKEMLSLLEH